MTSSCMPRALGDGALWEHLFYSSTSQKASTAAKYSSNRAVQRVREHPPLTARARMRSADAYARSSGRSGWVTNG
jgi:hypothetical protein